MAPTRRDDEAPAEQTPEDAAQASVDALDTAAPEGARIDPRTRQLTGATGQPVFGAAAPHPGDRGPTRAELLALAQSGEAGSGRKLKMTVGPLTHPETNEQVMFVAGERLPAWAEKLVDPKHPYAFGDDSAEPSPDEFDYSGSTIDEVKAYVGGDRDRAKAGLEVERDRKGGPRLGLIRHLEETAGGTAG